MEEAAAEAVAEAGGGGGARGEEAGQGEGRGGLRGWVTGRPLSLNVAAVALRAAQSVSWEKVGEGDDRWRLRTGELQVTAVLMAVSGAGWGQTGRGLGRAGIGRSWWGSLDCSGRKGRQRKMTQLRRWAGKRTGTGGKVADRGGAWAGEDGGYGRGGIRTGKRSGDQATRWRQVEADDQKKRQWRRGGSRGRDGGGRQRSRPR